MTPPGMMGTRGREKDGIDTQSCQYDVIAAWVRGTASADTAEMPPVQAEISHEGRLVIVPQPEVLSTQWIARMRFLQLPQAGEASRFGTASTPARRGESGESLEFAIGHKERLKICRL